MTKAMAAMLVSPQQKKLITILLYGDTNMAAMTLSANTLYKRTSILSNGARRKFKMRTSRRCFNNSNEGSLNFEDFVTV